MQVLGKFMIIRYLDRTLKGILLQETCWRVAYGHSAEAEAHTWRLEAQGSNAFL